jgi:hypothetical protein
MYQNQISRLFCTTNSPFFFCKNIIKNFLFLNEQVVFDVINVYYFLFNNCQQWVYIFHLEFFDLHNKIFGYLREDYATLYEEDLYKDKNVTPAYNKKNIKKNRIISELPNDINQSINSEDDLDEFYEELELDTTKILKKKIKKSLLTKLDNAF